MITRRFLPLLLTSFFSLLCITAFSQELYWDDPITLSEGEGLFPTVAGENTTSLVVWQEIETNENEVNQIWLSAQFFNDDTQTWETRQNFAGPFSYSGEIPNLFSVAATDSGLASIAVLTAPNTISIFTTSDKGESFTRTDIINDDTDLVAPRIFKDARGGFVAFATKGEEQSFSLEIARSSDGVTWSNFTDFTPSRPLDNSFVPTLSVLPNGNEMVVFQSALTANNRITYQLYSTYNTSSTFESWSSAFLLTNTGATGEDLNLYTNQRPFLHVFDNITYLAWERAAVTASQNPSVFIAQLTSEGRITGRIEQITLNNVIARQPVLFNYNGELTILWFDTRFGLESIYYAQKRGVLWLENRISTENISSVFGYPLVTNNNKDLHIFWEQTESNSDPQVTRLSVDRNAQPPTLTPISFARGQRTSSDRVTVVVTTPDDSSGVAGYSWIITQSAFLDPPERLMAFPDEDTISTFITQDGPWYIKARTLDNAGNWSDSEIITYYRDTTAPTSPQIAQNLNIDEQGFQNSNTFSLTWQNTDISDEIGGYTYNLQFIAPLSSYTENPENYSAQELSTIEPQLPPRVMTNDPIVSLNNQENGVYVFSVATIDAVGNIGEVTSTPIYLNKYVPFTAITAAIPETDIFGNVSLNILGKGFTYDGYISAIYIDRDGVAPYDLVLELSSNDYNIISDQQIQDISFSSLDEGLYRIGLYHTDRGLFMSRPLLPVSTYGTVKIGDYSYRFNPNWNSITQAYKFTLQISDILLWTVFAFALLGMIFAMRGIIITTKDTITVHQEVQALITGGSMPFTSKQKTTELKTRGISLKYKMMLFTSVLVLTVILLVAIPFGYVFIGTQEETLSDGLQERINVLSDSLASGVKNYMPSANLLELGLLLSQTESMEEVKYATILGLPAGNTDTHLDHVWVSNDPDIATKIDTENLVLGSSRYTESTIEPVLAQIEEINTTAITEVGEITTNISTLTQEGIALALATDTASVARRNEIQSIINQLTENLTVQLNALSVAGSGSLPEFNTESLSADSNEFLFYKPVLYRQGSEQTYARGIVILQISIENLLASLRDAQITIITTTLIIAFFAIAIGVIGSFMLATIIIRPISRLSAHVQMIRDTEDKEALDGKDIEITSKDEIGNLGEIVNDMTHGLVKAAAAAKDLTVGKEVQKMFIPLAVDSDGKKLTTGSVEDNNATFFGYYEGAKGVSGDYFDYLKLDDRHFAVIKCDVSGKGVPASLIMVEVATLFLNYFKDWSYKKDKYDLSGIVGRINDLIESRGFKGRFAAFTLCIFDSVGGDVHFCNAGDNLIHIYDASERKKKTIALTETPASGVFPTFMVEMKGGFVVEKLHLDKDDVLFLYTDGIEEAKRLFRDKDYNVINCEESGLKDGDVHGHHAFGMDGEEMAPERVNAIIEAVFAQSTYKIEKYHSPIDNEQLVFDFSTCEPTAENAIMALVSVEKIFRMYPTPKATEFDRVQVDRKIDEFLQEHFLQYSDYCSNKRDHTEFAEYMYYTHIKEDEQYDDLTLVAIKKK